MATRKKRRTPVSGQNRSKDLSSSDKSPTAAVRGFLQNYGYTSAFAGGIAVRLVVFAYMGFFNNDNHIAVIDYVSRHWTPPRADQFSQAYQPPLYYFLAAPLLRLGGVSAVHGLSLSLSIGTLLLIARLLRRLPWIGEETRCWALALAAFHPQFIMFSLFVSNDTLAIFLGALIFCQRWRLQLNPSLANHLLLAVGLGLGLLTKAVFLAFIVPLGLLIWMNGRRRALPMQQITAQIIIFLLIGGALGCYKYVENFIFFGDPTFSNLDFGDFVKDQRPTWLGVYSLFDFNLLKLVQSPIISTATVHSYPLMLYGSFWYSFIPESTFRSNLIAPFVGLGSLIYIAALLPTLVVLLGAVRIGGTLFRVRLSVKAEDDLDHRLRSEYEGILLLTLSLNFLLILFVGWKSDVLSVFQGRLLFPSYTAFLLAFNSGMEWADSSALKTTVIRCSLALLIVLFLSYAIINVWLAIQYPVNPLRLDHMPFKITL